MRLSLTTWDKDRFARARARRGWTIPQLAAKADLNTDTVYAYSSGATLPSPAALMALATTLGVETTELAPLQDTHRLHELRWHTGLTVDEFADRVGQSTERAAAVLRGANRPPDLRRWARALGVDEHTVQRAWETTRSDLKNRP